MLNNYRHRCCSDMCHIFEAGCYEGHRLAHFVSCDIFTKQQTSQQSCNANSCMIFVPHNSSNSGGHAPTSSAHSVQH